MVLYLQSAHLFQCCTGVSDQGANEQSLFVPHDPIFVQCSSVLTAIIISHGTKAITSLEMTIGLNKRVLFVLHAFL